MEYNRYEVRGRIEAFLADEKLEKDKKSFVQDARKFAQELLKDIVAFDKPATDEEGNIADFRDKLGLIANVSPEGILTLTDLQNFYNDQKTRNGGRRRRRTRRKMRKTRYTRSRR